MAAAISPVEMSFSSFNGKKGKSSVPCTLRQACLGHTGPANCRGVCSRNQHHSFSLEDLRCRIAQQKRRYSISLRFYRHRHNHTAKFGTITIVPQCLQLGINQSELVKPTQHCRNCITSKYHLQGKVTSFHNCIFTSDITWADICGIRYKIGLMLMLPVSVA